MPVSDIQLHLIFRYFDGDLSAEEEEQLMQQLQQDKELQQAFDQQILMHQFKLEEGVKTGNSIETESADDFLKRVSGSMKSGHTSTIVKPLPVVKRSKFRIAAAAVVVGVLVLSIYFINQKKEDNTVVKIPGKDSIAQTKQPAQTPLQNDPLPVPVENLQQLYADNYEVFKDELSVPPAATMFESEYKQEHYQQLANLPESALGTKGNGDPAEEAEIANYFHFYKALAALQVDDTAAAEKLLKKLSTGNAGETELANHVKWYLLMTYLKSNNNVAALQMSTAIANTKNSKYRKQAAQIREKLSE